MTGEVFVNVRKEFNTVDQARLFSKLHVSGIKGRELNWFENFLFDRNQFVLFDGVQSVVQSPVEFPRARSWVRYCFVY